MKSRCIGSRRRTTSWSHRGGFTLVELLVVIAIIGVLVGLLLPAVQVARESARRSSCTSKARQLATAFQNYYSARDKFPMYDTMPSNVTVNGWQGFGVWTLLLPFFEQQSVYDTIDFKTAAFDDAKHANQRKYSISVFRCPSDVAFGDASWGGINYAVSGGATRDLYSTGSPTKAWGVITRRNDTMVADVRDGLSKTILLSELLHGDNNGGVLDKERDVTQPLSLATAEFPSAAEIETAGVACDSSAAGYQVTNAGREWMGAMPCQTVINTIAPPNWIHVTCCTGGGFGYACDRNGVIPARSLHPGGVVIAAADGSTRFVMNAVDLLTWQRLGARADGASVNWND